ncbi:MAG TPA: TlpA disulfide reductase family protein [Candidatus Elarobacter sp.]|nr:TlpA disulfide reductase family protein [Candidatus Elarobacter sp.]
MPAAKSKPAPKPHVHGPNGVTSLPEHRPIAWKMDVLDGPAFDLSAYRGKVVFINIFATWCGPCRAEQPTVVTFAAEHPNDTMVIGMNYREEDNTVRAYRKKFDIPYPVAMDRYGRVLAGVYSGRQMVFPMTIVFRPDGTLSCAWAGDRNLAWLERERDAALAPLPSATSAPAGASPAPATTSPAPAD